MPVLYLDSCALVKLVVPEAETDVLGATFSGGTFWATSDLGRTEFMRVVSRREPGLTDDARRVMRAVMTISLDRDTYDLAGRIQPARLRSLDAIHVAAALSLGADLKALVTYDKRLAEAATLNGLTVLSPGATLD